MTGPFQYLLGAVKAGFGLVRRFIAFHLGLMMAIWDWFDRTIFRPTRYAPHHPNDPLHVEEATPATENGDAEHPMDPLPPINPPPPTGGPPTPLPTPQSTTTPSPPPIAGPSLPQTSEHSTDSHPPSAGPTAAGPERRSSAELSEPMRNESEQQGGPVQSLGTTSLEGAPMWSTVDPHPTNSPPDPSSSTEERFSKRGRPLSLPLPPGRLGSPTFGLQPSSGVPIAGPSATTPSTGQTRTAAPSSIRVLSTRQRRASFSGTGAQRRPAEASLAEGSALSTESQTPAPHISDLLMGDQATPTTSEEDRADIAPVSTQGEGSSQKMQTTAAPATPLASTAGLWTARGSASGSLDPRLISPQGPRPATTEESQVPNLERAASSSTIAGTGESAGLNPFEGTDYPSNPSPPASESLPFAAASRIPSGVHGHNISATHHRRGSHHWWTPVEHNEPTVEVTTQQPQLTTTVEHQTGAVRQHRSSAGRAVVDRRGFEQESRTTDGALRSVTAASTRQGRQFGGEHTLEPPWPAERPGTFNLPTQLQTDRPRIDTPIPGLPLRTTGLGAFHLFRGSIVHNLRNSSRDIPATGRRDLLEHRGDPQLPMQRVRSRSASPRRTQPLDSSAQPRPPPTELIVEERDSGRSSRQIRSRRGSWPISPFEEDYLDDRLRRAIELGTPLPSEAIDIPVPTAFTQRGPAHLMLRYPRDSSSADRSMDSWRPGASGADTPIEFLGSHLSRERSPAPAPDSKPPDPNELRLAGFGTLRHIQTIETRSPEPQTPDYDEIVPAPSVRTPSPDLPPTPVPADQRRRDPDLERFERENEALIPLRDRDHAIPYHVMYPRDMVIIGTIQAGPGPFYSVFDETVYTSVGARTQRLPGRDLSGTTVASLPSLSPWSHTPEGELQPGEWGFSRRLHGLRPMNYRSRAAHDSGDESAGSTVFSTREYQEGAFDAEEGEQAEAGELEEQEAGHVPAEAMMEGVEVVLEDVEAPESAERARREASPRPPVRGQQEGPQTRQNPILLARYDDATTAPLVGSPVTPPFESSEPRNHRYPARHRPFTPTTAALASRDTWHPPDPPATNRNVRQTTPPFAASPQVSGPTTPVLATANDQERYQSAPSIMLEEATPELHFGALGDTYSPDSSSEEGGASSQHVEDAELFAPVPRRAARHLLYTFEEESELAHSGSEHEEGLAGGARIERVGGDPEQQAASRSRSGSPSSDYKSPTPRDRNSDEEDLSQPEDPFADTFQSIPSPRQSRPPTPLLSPPLDEVYDRAPTPRHALRSGSADSTGSR